MGEEMMEIPKIYDTEDGYLMEYTHSDKANDLTSLQEKIEAAESIGLKTLVIPQRIQQNFFGSFGLYELKYYKYSKIDSDVLKHMKQEGEEVSK